MVMNANPVQRLDRNAWLSEAMEVLRESGVDHVKVEPLAKRLGVTKGSFYWHFKDRPDLLRALPEYWVESQTEPVLAHAESAGRTPVEKMRAVLEFLAREDPDRYDNAMRAWAQFDSDVADAVAAIDKRRMEYAGSLFRQAGLSDTEAAFRARLWYFYDVGEHITGDTPADTDERLRRAERRLALLTADL
jgi:AcrR family transcriptional regulator